MLVVTHDCGVLLEWIWVWFWMKEVEVFWIAKLEN